MLNNKKGIELSINMIVVIILGLAMLGVGFSIFFNAYNETVNIKENVDSQTQRQLNELLDTGEPIAIPINTKEVDRGDYVDFDLGISNELESDIVDARLFFLYIRFDDYAGRDTTDLAEYLNAEEITRNSCSSYNSYTEQNCADKWLLMPKENAPRSNDKFTDKFLLEKNQRHSVPLRFVLPRKIRTTSTSGLPAGQYIFNVDVYSMECTSGTNCDCRANNGCEPYFSKKKIYIKVK